MVCASGPVGTCYVQCSVVVDHSFVVIKDDMCDFFLLMWFSFSLSLFPSPSFSLCSPSLLLSTLSSPSFFPSPSLFPSPSFSLSSPSLLLSPLSSPSLSLSFYLTPSTSLFLSLSPISLSSTPLQPSIGSWYPLKFSSP